MFYLAWAWGGAASGGTHMPLNEDVNGYVGELTQAVPVGTTYHLVELF